jgi:hypothetical protein
LFSLAFLGTGTMVALLKHVGTADWNRDWLNMSINTPVSWSVHTPRTPARDAVLRVLTLLNVLLTLATVMESPQVLVAGHVSVSVTVLSQKQAKKLFHLSGSKTSLSATGLVFI